MGKKADKMYSDSPSIKKDDKGGTKIQKPSEATKEDVGLAGNPLPGSDGEMPIDVHAAERAETAKRHLQELKDMQKRHEADISTMHSRHHGATEGTKE